MISILVQVLPWTQTPITIPSPHLRPIYTLYHSQPEMCASQHHSVVKLICLPSIQVKRITRTIICTNWHPRLLSHNHWYPTDEYLHLTPVCITILSTSCKTNHLCIVYIIPGKNWHLVVLNFKLISYRPWAELSTGSVVRGRQQRCGYGRPFPWITMIFKMMSIVLS